MAFGPGLHVFPGGARRPGRRRCPPRSSGCRPPRSTATRPASTARRSSSRRSGSCGRRRGSCWRTPAGTRGPVDGSWRFRSAAETGRSRSSTSSSSTTWSCGATGSCRCRAGSRRPSVPRRYDTRFFVAWLPDGAEVVLDAGEVVGHEWLRPAEALAAMAAGRIDLWPPTRPTLQQLLAVASVDDLRAPGAGRARAAAVAAEASRERRPARSRSGSAARAAIPGADGRRLDRRAGRRRSSSTRATRRTRRPTRSSGRSRRLGGGIAAVARDVRPTRRAPRARRGWRCRLEVPLLGGRCDAERLRRRGRRRSVEVDDLVAAGRRDAARRARASWTGVADAVG